MGSVGVIRRRVNHAAVRSGEFVAMFQRGSVWELCGIASKQFAVKLPTIHLLASTLVSD